MILKGCLSVNGLLLAVDFILLAGMGIGMEFLPLFPPKPNVEVDSVSSFDGKFVWVFLNLNMFDRRAFLGYQETREINFRTC